MSPFDLGGEPEHIFDVLENIFFSLLVHLGEIARLLGHPKTEYRAVAKNAIS